jgi:hypothetical protein
MFIPRPVKAWIMVSVFAGIEFFMSVFAREHGVANLVHLVGIAVGVGYTYWFVRGQGPKISFRRGPRLRVVKGGGQPGAYGETDVEVDPAEVDRLLDKIANQGIGSLSRHERAVLETASRNRRGR